MCFNSFSVLSAILRTFSKVFTLFFLFSYLSCYTGLYNYTKGKQNAKKRGKEVFFFFLDPKTEEIPL